MITLAAALKDMKAFDGVVLMGPLIHIDPALASPMKLWVVRMLSRIAPNLSVTQPLGNWETRHRFQNPIFFWNWIGYCRLANWIWLRCHVTASSRS